MFVFSNSENLKPFNKLTVNEQRLIAKQGGKKSGIVRLEKRKMREILEILLSQDLKQSGVLKSTKEAIMVQVVKKALSDDLKTVEFIQNTIGEKPIEKSMSLSPTPESKTEAKAIIDEILREISSKSIC